MKKKVIIPDYTPRKSVAQKPTVYSAPLQNEVNLPLRISISESQKLPIFVPPPEASSIKSQPQPPPAVKRVTFQSASAPSLTQLPFLGQTSGANCSFSPNLETFPNISESYFATTANLPDIAQWSLYPSISSINMNGYNIVGGNTITFSTINVISCIAGVLDLDGNNLTTAGQELLFNNQPLATVSSVTSNITGWSLYPAISTILADNNAITGVTDIQLSSINGQVYPPPVPASQWVSTATSQLDMSNYGITNISSLNGVTSINGTAYPSASQWVSTAASALDMSNYGITNISSLNGVTAINGTAYPGPVADISKWADYVASSNVTIPNKDLNMTTTSPGVSYNKANLNANVQFGDPTNVPLRPDFDAYCGNVTFGGLATPLTTMNVNSIGGINLTSATGVNVTGGGTVTVSGGGGVAVSGGGGVTVGGLGGVAITGAGAISVAAGGVSVAGGGVAITAGGLAINAGLTEIGTIGGPGGGLNVFGSDISMIPVGAITAEIYTEYLKSYSGTNTMQITGVSTINGTAYPPTAGGATAFSYNIYVSNISGSDTTGDGKISNPYQTITKAIAVAATIAETNQVIINLACGTYTENLTISRANLYITGGSTSLSTATVINGSITVDTTVSSQLILIGGLSSVYFNNFIYNNSVAKNQSYVITDCLIVPGAGTSAIVFTDTSVGGNGDITIQNSLIYMSDTTAVTISNGRISMINSQITNNPGLANATVSLITTSGTGGVNLFGCSLIQGSTASTVQPLINMTNNASTGSPMLINSCILQYTSATADTGTGAKCCIRFSNSAAISNVSVINCLLICEGARTTNGSTGQYVAIQRTGAGTITLSYGQNLCGATANHLPATAAGLTKTAYIALGN